MPDVFTKAKRSEVMSPIRGRGNKDTELALMKLLRLHHITGWRRNQKVFGKPDFIFRQLRLALFVDGCFWHGCPSHCTTPASNRMFWRKKFVANKTRDRRVNHVLRKQGWRVCEFGNTILPNAARRVFAGSSRPFQRRSVGDFDKIQPAPVGKRNTSRIRPIIELHRHALCVHRQHRRQHP